MNSWMIVFYCLLAAWMFTGVHSFLIVAIPFLLIGIGEGDGSDEA